MKMLRIEVSENTIRHNTALWACINEGNTDIIMHCDFVSLLHINLKWHLRERGKFCTQTFMVYINTKLLKESDA